LRIFTERKETEIGLEKAHKELETFATEFKTRRSGKKLNF